MDKSVTFATVKRIEIRMVNVSPKLYAFIKRVAKKNKRTIQAQAQYMLEAYIK